MNEESTIGNNIRRIATVIEAHEKQIDKCIDIIRKTRSNKIHFLTEEHDNWVKEGEERIRNIEKMITDGKEAHEKACKDANEDLIEKEAAFLSLKDASQAYMEAVSKNGSVLENITNCQGLSLQDMGVQESAEIEIIAA